MKKYFILTAVAAFGLSACTHTKSDTPKSTKPEKPNAESTCNPGDEGYPKCATGGGVGGPIT